MQKRRNSSVLAMDLRLFLHLTIDMSWGKQKSIRVQHTQVLLSDLLCNCDVFHGNTIPQHWYNTGTKMLHILLFKSGAMNAWSFDPWYILSKIPTFWALICFVVLCPSAPIYTPSEIWLSRIDLCWLASKKGHFVFWFGYWLCTLVSAIELYCHHQWWHSRYELEP